MLLVCGECGPVGSVATISYYRMSTPYTQINAILVANKLIGRIVVIE